MRRRSLPSFVARVRLFVGLVAAYLIILQALHVLDLARAHERLRADAAARALAVAELTWLAAGPRTLVENLLDWRARGVPPRRLELGQAFLIQHGLTAAQVLTPEGFGLDAGVRMDPDRDGLPRSPPDDEQARRLRVGETVVDLDGGLAGPAVHAVVTARRPILDPSGRLLGLLQVEVGAERLARSRAELRRAAVIQGGSMLVFVVLLATFTRWMLRPLRLLDRAARALDPAQVAAAEGQDDTGFVIETYRRVIEQLQEKEQELRRLREVERDRANELQELNASIVDSMVSGALVLDLSGRVRTLNEVARHVFGVTGERAIGRHFRDALPQVPELHARLQQCLDEGLILRRDEIRLSLPGSGRRDVGLTLSPLRDRSGRRTGALCLVVDLTEVKRLQQVVRLKEGLAELGELSAGIAHEFRNSLATILGFASLAERQGEGEVVEHARAIRSEVTALRAVVDDFLRFANPTRIVIESIDLAEVLRDAAADAHNRAAGRNVEIAIQPGLPTVAGDDTLLRRVFTNLLRNAVDAIADGGRVAVHSEVAPVEEGDAVWIHVDDDGPGIPEADRERIFQPFFTRKAGGTGLGLALARKVVVHHGGHLVATDSPLGGARLSVRLPRRLERGTNSPAESLESDSTSGNDS